MSQYARTSVFCEDDNIEILRQKYPNGLHFAVGDLHGEVNTLISLMEKIQFDAGKDHIYFVGDYNGGGSPRALIEYMSQYYQEDNEAPGFHMIRGNHERERELYPLYELENLPDIMVVRGKSLNFYLVHAGMVSAAFDLINSDMDNNPETKVFAYHLENRTCCYDAPLRQIVWSLRGLYSQHSEYHVWPSEDNLTQRNACIIHGHAPYCFFKKENRNTYGHHNVFFEKPHIFFCEELHSFNIDSNIKGRYRNGESYRGLSALCFEVYDDIASENNGVLTVDNVCEAENGIFSAALDYSRRDIQTGQTSELLNAKPKMKTFALDDNGKPILKDQ